MTKLLYAAVCSRCGGQLDRRTLKCPYCGIAYLINWEKIIPTVTGTKPPRKYYRHRDRRLDGVLLTMLQIEANQQDVEVILSLRTGKTTSTIEVYVRDKKTDRLVLGGKILAKETHYVVMSSYARVNRERECWERLEYRISYTKQLRTADRIYDVSRILRRKPYSISPSKYLGEDELFRSSELEKTIYDMVNMAYETNNNEKERAEEERQRAARPWWKRTLGVY